jgi:hypothetical protein
VWARLCRVGDSTGGKFVDQRITPRVLFARANPAGLIDAQVATVENDFVVTAEIVVMNREAVAMAADSAVTAGNKIYQSANKLFTLSKVHPVGILISNAAHFMGVPWETVVKMYREATIRLPEHETVKGHAIHFIASLTSPKLCTDEQQSLRVLQIARSHLQKVQTDAQTKWLSKLMKTGRCTLQQKRQIVAESLSAYRTRLAAFPDQTFAKFTDAKLARRYKQPLEQAIAEGMRGIELTASSKRIAYQCAKLSIMKMTGSDLHSTVAITGFGSSEFFPSLEVYEIDGVIGGEIKITSRESREIDRKDNTALVKALAQSEMVQRFMEGVDLQYQRAVDEYLHKFWRSLGMTDAQIKPVLDKFQNDMRKHRSKEFIAPIIKTLVSLPKHDMAKMAEALVSLTSIKRRVSDEMETVADPIDVAVISKGDGFVWIKRKHYFASDLNPHFATQYFRGH